MTLDDSIVIGPVDNKAYAKIIEAMFGLPIDSDISEFFDWVSENGYPHRLFSTQGTGLHTTNIMKEREVVTLPPNVRSKKDSAALESFAFNIAPYHAPQIIIKREM